MTATQNPPRVPQSEAPIAPSRGLIGVVVELLASMKLTVVVLLLFGVLTWAGTLAQRTQGLFLVQRDFFESFFVLWDTDVAFGGVHLRVPLPGGYLLMVVLFANILVGGVVRLRWSRRNVGILVTHLGIALLLIAGFVKLNWSYAGRVTLWEHEQTATMVSFHDFELALLRQDGSSIGERTLPEADLRAAADGTVRIDDPALPFTITVSHWFDNCAAQPKGPMFDVDVPVVRDDSGPGVYLARLDVDPERGANSAGCYVTVTERNSGTAHTGIVLGLTYRVTNAPQRPFTFTADGRTWGLELRRETRDLPFAVQLDRFQKTDHPGTLTPRDFSSWITVLDGDHRLPAHIYMNHPLRRDGYVFFQTNWGPQPGESLQGPPWYSTFEVANNPSDAWPKYASYVILLGLLLHFLPKLLRYLRSSSHRSSLPEMS